ncbi:MAG: high potential iron sulfur protein [Hyphomicrobiales bacterium]|nr:high potential iron sulfur protein [Hyphomicrobiales bacterium]MDE2113342.1 high potential iron sulfur protein [Hyphomicrobiales bacterium]
MSDKVTTLNLSRRNVIGLVAGVAPLMMVASASAGAQVSPKSVGYVTSPKAGHECSGCNLFVSPGSCKVVSGAISPKGWCQLWVAKA